MVGNHPCLLPVHPALPEEPQHDSLTSHPLCALLSPCGRPTDLARLLDFRLRFRQGRLLSASWLLSSCSLRAWWLCSVVLFSGSLLGSWSSTSAVSSTLAECADAWPLPVFLCVCMIILIIRRCVVWSFFFFFITSVIVHVPEA